MSDTEREKEIRAERTDTGKSRPGRSSGNLREQKLTLKAIERHVSSNRMALKAKAEQVAIRKVVQNVIKSEQRRILKAKALVL